MRRITRVSVLALTFSILPVFAQSFTFTVSAVEDTVKAESQIRVKIRLTNSAKNDASITAIPSGSADHPEIEGFRPIVKNSRGEKPPLTKWGRLVYEPPWASDNPPNPNNSVGSYAPEPAKTYTAEVVMNALYDMSPPGQYATQIPYKACYFGVPLNVGREEEFPPPKPSTRITVVP